MDPERAFLDGLIGSWHLEGSMFQPQADGTIAEISLRQSVEGAWILADTFIELRFRETDESAKAYEARALIGFDQLTGKYVLHLFDTFGVSSDYRFGTGLRREDFIRFRFDYLTGPFFNEVCREEDGTWSWHLSYEKDGEVCTFAEKRMRRAG